MMPAASVSGFYLSHPESVYFNVGKVGDDQLADYAARSGQDASMLKRSLSALL
jgi:5-methyltetrahydrofolate--homocysteine methyltransferase